MAKSQATETPEDVRKAELLELLRRIKAAVELVIKRDPAPVVLAAHPEIQGHFRDIAKWKELLPEGIQENPDALTPEALHQKACAVMMPRGTTLTYKKYDGVTHGGAVTDPKPAADATAFIKSRLK